MSEVTTVDWPERFLGAFRLLHARLEKVLDVWNCRECWLQVEILLAMREWDPTFAINQYCYPKMSGCKADFSSGQERGMVAELKLLGNGYLPKCFDGSGQLGGFVPESPEARVDITEEHLSAATGYFLHDCARLKKVDLQERYMILVVDRRGPLDRLGAALIAARVSEEERTWEAPSGSYLVRVWRI